MGTVKGQYGVEQHSAVDTHTMQRKSQFVGGERFLVKLVGINGSHGQPDVLALRRMVKELDSLALFVV